MRGGLAVRGDAQLQADDHAAGAERGAGDVAAAHGRESDGPVPGDPHPRKLLHDEPAHDEGRVAARAAEEELCEPRDHPARRGEAPDPRGPAGGEDAHAAAVQCESVRGAPAAAPVRGS